MEVSVREPVAVEVAPRVPPRIKLVRGRGPGGRRRVAQVARKRRWLQPRVVYTALTVAGAALVTAGVALVFPPAALVLAGLALGGLGMLGLAMHVRGVR
jgi:hypothetical protein